MPVYKMSIYKNIYMRSEVLLVVTMKIAICLDVMLCVLLESYFSTLQVQTKRPSSVNNFLPVSSPRR